MSFTAEAAHAALSRTPGVLSALLADAPAAWSRADEGAGTYSVLDVVAHLCLGERTDWIPRARRILEHGTARAFEPFDRWAHRDRARPLNLDEEIAAFAELRRANLDALVALDLDAAKLAHRGLHPELGEVTLGELLATWTAHDLVHLAQVSRILARQLAEDVGPWRHPDYMRILAGG